MTINAKTLAFLIGMALFGALAWGLLSPLFIDREVNEALPTRSEVQAMTPSERQAAMQQAMSDAASRSDRRASDTMPENRAPKLLHQGAFADADAVHRGQGNALLYRLEDGSRLLRLENFRVTNGPALVVLLATHPNPESASDVREGYFSLGKLKGNLGNQNYAVPDSVVLDDYHSVVIWCELFDVLFSPAPLSPLPTGGATARDGA